MTTLKEVAKSAGVSTVTASSVLSGAGRVRVSTETASRIKETARNMNYVPRAAARGLRTGKVQAIGFVTSVYTRTRWQAHWQEVLRGVSDMLWDRDERLVISLPKSPEDEVESLRQLAFGHQVDGLILQNCTNDDPRVQLLKEADLPFVSLGGAAQSNFHAVAFDTVRFANLLCRHLLKQAGALAVLAAKPKGSECEDFLEACRGIVGSMGVSYMQWTGAFIPDANMLLQARKTAGGKPLGILLLRQLLPELLSALSQANLELVRDVNIIYVAGGDDIPLTPAGLEVVPLDCYTLGRRAAKLLFQVIDRHQTAPAPGRHLILPGMAEHLLEEQREP